MLNQVVIVGRLVKEVLIEEVEGKKKGLITIACPRAYKNVNGEYDTDFVDCVIWKGIVDNVLEYYHKGDVIGVRGRIETSNVENEDGSKKKITEIVADKITFLSSKKSDEMPEE